MTSIPTITSKSFKARPPSGLCRLLCIVGMMLLFASLPSFANIPRIDGNRTKETRTESALPGQAARTLSTVYAYDLDDRLIETRITHSPVDANNPDTRTVWTLDGVGNRLSETITRLDTQAVLSSKAYTYNARDQLTRVVDATNQLEVAYRYDGHGNRIKRELWRGAPLVQVDATNYTFDARDRLIKAEPEAPNTANAPTLAFIYDADDHKIARIETPWANGTPQSASARVTYELREGIDLLHEAMPGNATSTTPNAQGLRITDSYRRGAKLDRHIRFDESGNGGGSSNPQAQVRFYQLDALDTPVVISDATGNAIASNTLDAWGNIQQQTANGQSSAPQRSADANANPLLSAQANLLTNDNQSIGFTGYQKDSDLGLYYANARWYDPMLGQFNMSDPAMGVPAKPVTFNPYLYANGNPTVYVDPDGRVGFLTTLRNQFDDADEYFRLTAEQNPTFAKHIGMARGVVSLVGGGVRGVNLASDGIASLLDESYYGEVATQGRRELAESLDPVFAYASRYSDAPLRTTLQTNLGALSSLGRTIVAAAHNDGGAVSDFYSGVTQFAVPALGARAGLFGAASEATASARAIDDMVPDTSVAARTSVIAESPDAMFERRMALIAENDFGPSNRPTHADFVASAGDRVVTFGGSNMRRLYDRHDATLGAADGNVWAMPIDDAARLQSRSDVVTQTGHAPGVTRSYLEGSPFYGVSVPTRSLSLRSPMAADAGINPHWRPGGYSGVQHDGQWTQNATREIVTPGGATVPPGSVFFQFNPDGSWTEVRRF